MKGGNFNLMRGNGLSFTITALVCATILLWAWERTPFAPILPSEDQFEILSSGVQLKSPIADLSSLKNKTSMENDFLDASKTRETGTDSAETGYNVATLLSEASGSSKKGNEGGLMTPPAENKGIQLNSSMTDLSSLKSRTSMEKDFPNELETKETSIESTEKVYDVAPVLSPEMGNEGSLPMPPAEKKGCNYAKGKWLADIRRPFYSGFGCKQWLSKMWACRLTKRTDFSYEGFRWQPENCEMPEFEGSSFLRRMQDKTIAFIGDSLGRQQFQSLMCMVTGGKESPEIENVGKKYGLVKARGAIRPDGWAYQFPSTNTTILYYWSASLCELEPLSSTNRNTDYAMHLDRPATFLRQYLPGFDVLVLNTGHHWNQGKITANRWVMYVGGKPNDNKVFDDIRNAKNFTVYSIVKWLDLQLLQHPKLKAFFRTMSPRHYVNGDWNTGGSCDNMTPLAGGREVSQDKPSDPVIGGAVKGTRVMLLDITAISQLRDDGHISKYSVKGIEGVQDCLHWCLPGIPDTWNELLFAQL